MKTQFDIKEVIKTGKIQNELDLERALIAVRKLRVLSKENPELKVLRKKLTDIIEEYENTHWSKASKINDGKLAESDLAELVAEKERLFINNRKALTSKGTPLRK